MEQTPPSTSPKPPSSEVHAPLDRPRHWWFWIAGIVVALCIIVAGFVMWVPENSPSLVWENIVGGPSEPPASQSGVSYTPLAGSRVLEDGMYVTHIYFNGKKFIPATVVVTSGENVRFINTSNLTMRVGSRVETLSSPIYASITQPFAEGKGSTYEVTLSQPGIWSYYNLSSINPLITGTIYVR